MKPPSLMFQKLSSNPFQTSLQWLFALLCRLLSVRQGSALPPAARPRRRSRFGSTISVISSCDSLAPSAAGLPSRSSPTRSTSYWLRCRSWIPWPTRPNGGGNPMARALRFGATLSFVALASVTAGCAVPQSHVSSAGSGGKANPQLGFATRAVAALNANNVPMAISLAEQAVTNSPSDAGFRALLGHAYFAGGRFKSAEGAYKDALALSSNQPQVVLKLVLTEIAQGKNSEALAFLEAGREVLDASDYGLAVALAGRSADAIEVLQMAARAPDADSRVRQNLARAYALSGDWTNARTVAAQDVPADQIDARIRQWMQMATPGQGSNAVAQLVGGTPAPVDPAQPVQLALHKTETQMAQAAEVPAPAPAPAAAP